MSDRNRDFNFDSLIQKLEQDETDIREILSDLNAEVATYQGHLKKVLEAKAALGKKPAKKKSGAKKPSPSKSDVASAIQSIEANAGEISESELRTKVEDKLVADGFAKTGLALRFKEILKSRQAV